MKAPSAPDPKETAAAQGQMNKETAIANYGLNATNQVTPQGNLTYEQIGSWSDGTPRYQATQSYSPEQQKLYDQQTQLQGKLGGIANTAASNIGGLLSKPMDTSKLPKAGSTAAITMPKYDKFTGGPALQTSYVDDFSSDRQKVEDALMGRLNPQLDRDKATLDANLRAKGVVEGSEAYDNAIRNYGQQANDARTSAILAGGQEQTRLANLAAQQAGFGNAAQQQMFQNTQGTTAANNALAQQGYQDQQGMFGLKNTEHAQALSEAYAARNQPINEITALMGGAGVQNPNFVTTPGSNIQGVDYTGLVNQKYQAEQQNYQSGMGGLFGLGGALVSALPFSDRRLKTNILRIGTHSSGFGIYTYRFREGGPVHIGFMAQEVIKRRPDAIVTDPISGYMKVNYARAMEAA